MCIPMNVIPSNDSFKRRNLYAHKNRLHLRKVVKSYINSGHFDFSFVLEVTSQFNTAISRDKSMTRRGGLRFVFSFFWFLDLFYARHNRILIQQSSSKTFIVQKIMFTLICITVKMPWIAVCDMSD